MLRRVPDVRYGYSAPLSRWLREHPQHIRQKCQQHCLPKISWYPCLIKVPKWIKMEIHAWTFIELRLKLKWLLNAKTEGVCCCLRTTCGPCGRASAPMALLFWCAWAILGWNVLTLENPGHQVPRCPKVPAVG